MYDICRITEFIESVVLNMRIVCALIFNLFIFYCLGRGALLHLGQNRSIGYCLSIGLCINFIIFQTIALPLILYKVSFNILCWIFAIILIGVVLTLCIIHRKKMLCSDKLAFSKAKVILFVFILLGVVLQIMTSLSENYWGFDTAYYIGMVSTTLERNSMYIYDGMSGVKVAALPFRYILSLFYIYFAVICKVFGISAIACFRYIVAPMCIMFADLIIYLIGRKLFGNIIKAETFTLFFILLNFFWVSGFSNSRFLLSRGYEAKGFCANVVIPLIWLFGLEILQRGKADRVNAWRMMFILGLACVPISMSSLLIAPIMIFCVTVTCVLLDRDIKAIKYGIVCVIPNAVYAIVYFLSLRGLIVIGV